MRMRRIRVVLVALLGLSLSLAASSEQQTALRVSPTSLSFNSQAGGQQPDARFLTLENVGTEVLRWRASSDVDWIILGASTARIGPGQVVKLLVLADAEGLAAGTYQGTITVENVDAQDNATEVAVTLTLSNPARLDVSPSSLSFSAQEGGSNPSAKTLTIKNTGGEPLNWTASTTATWLILRPSQGRLTTGSSASVSVEVDLSGLSVGSHKAQITVASPEAVNSPVIVAVILVLSTTKSASQLAISPTSLIVSAQVNQSTIIIKTIFVKNSGDQTLTWKATGNVNWLSLKSLAGTLKAGHSSMLRVSFDIGGLSAGTHTATITISSPEAKNSPVRIPVTLTLSATKPVSQLDVSPTSLIVSAQVNQSTITIKTIFVKNSGDQTLTWKATGNANWLSLKSLAGTLKAGHSSMLRVSFDIGGLSAGTHTTTITISSPEAKNSPVRIPITLTLNATKPVSQLAVTPINLNFSAQTNQSTIAAKAITIINNGEQTLAWKATENANWLSLSRSGGTLKAGQSSEVSIFINAKVLSAGTRTATTSITISSPEAGNSPIRITVTLTLGTVGGPTYFDSDKDGVPDAKDYCPLTPGKKDNNGCP